MLELDMRQSAGFPDIRIFIDALLLVLAEMLISVSHI